MKPLSVLIVDDDAMMRISLKSLIAWQEHGYRLIGEASDGEQALEICPSVGTGYFNHGYENAADGWHCITARTAKRENTDVCDCIERL